MNKLSLILTVFLLNAVVMLTAQETKPPLSAETIQAQKLSFITERIELSPEELKVFLPIYRQELDKLKMIRKSNIVNQKLEDLSDGEVEANINASFNREGKLLEVKKDYFTIFKSILPIKKVAKLYLAEREFNGDLINKLQKKTAQK